MILYDGTPAAECALAQWWLTLQETAEVRGLMRPPDRSLTAFLARFRPPTVLWMAADEMGLWATAWASPWLEVGAVGIWVRPDRRHTRRALWVLEAALEALFRHWPVLVVLTAEPRHVRMYQHWGAVALGTLPGADGPPMWLGYATRATWRPHALAPQREAILAHG